MEIQIENDVAAVDELLVELEKESQTGEVQLAREHLTGARTYLLGAMYDEYALNLSLAHAALHEMGPRGERLEELLSRLRH